MESFLLAIFFVFNLALGLALAWSWISLRSHQKKLEIRLSESLDDQDLSAFQESVKDLIADLNAASDEGLRQIDVTRDALEKVIQRGETLDKKIARRLESLEKGRDKLEKGLAATLEQALKRASPQKRGAAKNKKTSSKNSASDAAVILQVLSGITTPPSPQDPLIAPLALSKSFHPQEVNLETPSAIQTEHDLSNGRTPHEQVLTLAKKGQDKMEIAAATGLLPGEIELILNLKSRHTEKRS